MRKVNVWLCETCHKLLLLGATKGDNNIHLTCIHAYILPADKKKQFPFTKMTPIEL